MRQVARYLAPVVIALLAFAAFHYFSTLSPAEEKAQLRCIFALVDGRKPVSIPSGQMKIDRLTLAVELSRPSTEDGIILWHADGAAMVGDAIWKLSGSAFSNQSNQIRGLGLWRGAPGTARESLRIMTLNEQGILDWDEKKAFVSFEGDQDKLGHPFSYRCQLTRDAGN